MNLWKMIKDILKNLLSRKEGEEKKEK